MKKRSILNVFVMTLYLLLATTVMAHPQDSAQDNTQSAPTDSRKMQAQVASGQKVKIQGTILKREYQNRREEEQPLSRCEAI